MEDGNLKLTKVTPVHFTEETVVLKGLENGIVIISKSVPGAYEGMNVRTEAEAKAEKAAEEKEASQRETEKA